MKAKQTKKNLLFLIKFFIIFGALEAAIVSANLGFLENQIASFEAGLLGLQSQGNSIALPSGENFLITQSCTGLVSSAILAAIIFSLRRPKLKKKAVMFLLGMAALLLLNLARVYIVLLAGMKYGIYAADILHILSWFAMAAFIIAIWMVATKKMARVKSYSELL